MDVIPAEEDIFERLETEEECRNVRELVHRELDERQRDIICLRYGLDGNPPLTQREVAEHFKISRSYISRIEKKSLQILKGLMDPT